MNATGIMRSRPAVTGWAMIATPRLGDQTHSGQRIGCVMRLVVPLPWMQDAVECLGPIPHDAPGDEGVGDVRTPHRRVECRLRHHVVPLQVVVSPDVADDPLGTADPITADAIGLGPQRVILRIEEVAENMHAAPLVLRGELHPRDEGHPRATAASPASPQPVERS